MRRYFAVQVCFELKWELHEYFRVVCCDFCYSRFSQFVCVEIHFSSAFSMDDDCHFGGSSLL